MLYLCQAVLAGSAERGRYGGEAHPFRPGNFALAEESAPVEASARGGGQAQCADVVRLPYQARHAKAADPEPLSLPIRSAERRR